MEVTNALAYHTAAKKFIALSVIECNSEFTTDDYCLRGRIIVKNHLHWRNVSMKTHTTVTVLFLALTSLDDASQIETILFVSCHPR